MISPKPSIRETVRAAVSHISVSNCKMLRTAKAGLPQADPRARPQRSLRPSCLSARALVVHPVSSLMGWRAKIETGQDAGPKV